MKKNLFYYALPVLGLIGFSACSDDDDYVDPDDTIIVEDSKPSATVSSEGFYVVNEDWFGWDNGSVNYFKNDGSVVYRAFRAANNGEKLGVTTEFATIYGDNVYFVSKQGKRFVVADAKTFKEKKVITDIPDGRAFVGINTKKGYISTYKGVSILNIETMSVEGTIAEISGETGNMCLVGKYVFAITKSKGAYVIDTETDKVERLIEATDFAMLTQGKDGSVWIGASKKLIKLNPHTLETSEVDITDAPISGTWFAWNAGSLCASTQKNVLYWTKSTAVVKYDIDKNELNTSFYTLGKDEAGKQLSFYGAALRVDPLTDHLVLMVKRSGWGDAGSYNWLHIVSNTGTLVKDITVSGDNGLAEGWGTTDGRYFWFPAMPFFEDVNAPEILLNQIILMPNERKAISLNDKIVDADNTSASIIKSISFENNDLAKYEMRQDSLIVTANELTGKTKLTIRAHSNGKSVEKEVRIDIRK